MMLCVCVCVGFLQIDMTEIGPTNCNYDHIGIKAKDADGETVEGQPRRFFMVSGVRKEIERDGRHGSHNMS